MLIPFLKEYSFTKIKCDYPAMYMGIVACILMWPDPTLCTALSRGWLTQSKNYQRDIITQLISFTHFISSQDFSLLIGNVSRLKFPSTEQAAADPVDTKVMELMLEGARPGVIFGKKGVHIKELCNSYNVTARFTKAGADRQKYFYDDPVLVVISAPVGHDQDISHFEDALTKHVESVKKKEKKHRENVSSA